MSPVLDVMRSEMPANASWHQIRGSVEDLALRRSLWIALGSFTALAALTAATFVAGVLYSPKVRALNFNLLLVALVIPDVIFNTDVAVTSYINAYHNRFVSSAACSVESALVTFGFMAEVHINAMIVYEVYRLLVAIKAMRDYESPPRRTVLVRCCAAYVWAALVSSGQLLGLDMYSPFMLNGMFCLPLQSSREGLLFSWLALSR